MLDKGQDLHQLGGFRLVFGVAASAAVEPLPSFLAFITTLLTSFDPFLSLHFIVVFKDELDCLLETFGRHF